MIKMEKRADYDLAFLLRYENVAWYNEGKVRILDRRIYPIETRFVECTSHKEVAQAIANMVTQSYGPYTAAAMGMVLAAYEARGMSYERRMEHLRDAAYTLSHARPTTSAKMERIVNGAVALAEKCEDSALVDTLFEYAFRKIDDTYKSYISVGKYLAELIPDGGTVMTQCYADTVIGTTLRALRESGKTARFICPETRPYFQGSRLTASVICDMGFDVTVISDNMPAYVLNKKKVDLFTSAADVITVDGHVVNKVGTLQIALAAHYWGIPYFVTGNPDPAHKDISRITIEERNSEEVLHAREIKVTMDGVKGYYPAFDITPPNLCCGVVTDKGVLPPYCLNKYFED